MHPITRLISRIAHGDEILIALGIAVIAMLVAAAVNNGVGL